MTPSYPSDHSTPQLLLPRAFPTLRREENELVWTVTAKASADDLRVYLAYLLKKLAEEVRTAQAVAQLLVLRDPAGRVAMPRWLAIAGPLPEWVAMLSEADYLALEREHNLDVFGDEEE